MTKQIQILLATSLIIFVIALIYYQGHKQAISSEIIKQQKEEINIKNDVIQTKEFQQKIINKTSISNNSNSRKQWLRFLWQKRNETD